MRTLLLQSAIWLCVGATFCPTHANDCSPQPQERVLDERQRAERYEATKAEGIASVEVGGEATGSRRIDLNGATGGWEVFVKIKGEKFGWRVVIDRDTWTVRSKQKVGAS